MKAATLLVLALLTAGCATPPPGPSGRIPQGGGATDANARVFDPRITVDDHPVNSVMDASPDEAFAALPDAFADLQLEINAVDRAARLLVVDNTRVRRIAGERPSRFLICGQNLLGSNADRHDVYITVQAQIRPAPEGGSELRTMVFASARDGALGGTSLDCSSNGQLELRLAAALSDRLNE